MASCELKPVIGSPFDQAYDDLPVRLAEAIHQGLLQDQQSRIVGGHVARDCNAEGLQRGGIAEPGLDAPHRLEGPDHQSGTHQ